MLRLVNDSTRWNTALATLPYRHVLQSWEWGQFKSRWGWTPRYFLNEELHRRRAGAAPHLFTAETQHPLRAQRPGAGLCQQRPGRSGLERSRRHRPARSRHLHQDRSRSQPFRSIDPARSGLALFCRADSIPQHHADRSHPQRRRSAGRDETQDALQRPAGAEEGRRGPIGRSRAISICSIDCMPKRRSATGSSSARSIIIATRGAASSDRVWHSR